MSYPRDLEEYTDAEIVAEYERRVELGEAGSCTYCEQRRTDCKCRMSKKRGQFQRVFSGRALIHSFFYYL